MLFYVLFDPRLWVLITIAMSGDAGRTGGYGYLHGHGGRDGVWNGERSSFSEPISSLLGYGRVQVHGRLDGFGQM